MLAIFFRSREINFFYFSRICFLPLLCVCVTPALCDFPCFRKKHSSSPAPSSHSTTIITSLPSPLFLAVTIITDHHAFFSSVAADRSPPFSATVSALYLRRHHQSHFGFFEAHQHPSFCRLDRFSAPTPPSLSFPSRQSAPTPSSLLFGHRCCICSSSVIGQHHQSPHPPCCRC